MLISKFSGDNIKRQIEELEKQYSIELPSQYVDFLCRYNGGDTPKTWYRQGNAIMRIRGFYGFGDVRHSLKSCGDLSDWVRKDLFPIACDYNGNDIAISLADDRTHGNIYFVDHEAGNQRSFVIDNLKLFIKKCDSEMVSKNGIKTVKEREEALIKKGRGHIITDELRQMWQAEIDVYESLEQEEVIIKD